MLSTTARLLATAVLGVAALGACSSGTATPPESSTTPGAVTVGPSSPSGTSGTGGAGSNGSSGNDGGAPGPAFVTPSPGGSTPVLRYAWCLREKGLPAVVIGGNLAFEDGGTGQQGPPANQAEVEAACAKENQDYTPPNHDQR